MREIAERFAAAGDVRAIGEILGDACERALPFGSFGFAVLEPGASERPCAILRSGEVPVDWLLRRFPEILVAMERDLAGGIAAGLSERRAFDIFEKYPAKSIENTELVQDHWRVIRCDQQLVAPLWRAGVPVGYSCVVRSRREARFTAADLRYYEELRVRAERALEGVAALGHGDLSRTLDALSQVFPHAAFLFDAAGRLRWMSDEGAERLGIAAIRVGAGRLIRGNGALEALSRRAAALARDPAAEVQAGLRREGVLRRSERLAVRRFGEGDGQLLLLALAPALAARGAGDEATAPLPGLGAVESRVARLAAEGQTVLGISARLGVSAATVRTHLHRMYVKLGVHGRAELAFALLRGDSRGPAGTGGLGQPSR
jgi:DNA-binding NarL/FixJ family response regulator